MENTNEKKFQVAEVQLIYKSKVKPADRLKISSSRDAYKLLSQSWDAGRLEFIEQFKVIYTNRASKVLAVLEVSSGGTNSTVADPKVIFVAALKTAASGFILAHNHPSGSLEPSQGDRDLTKRLKQGADLLGMQLLDHIILTSEKYFSFADEGLL